MTKEEQTILMVIGAIVLLIFGFVVFKEVKGTQTNKKKSDEKKGDTFVNTQTVVNETNTNTTNEVGDPSKATFPLKYRSGFDKSKIHDRTAVKIMQKRLNMATGKEKITEDGEFGTKTKDKLTAIFKVSTISKEMFLKEAPLVLKISY